ncbi:MAG: ABC transporter ATP-binding protein [Lachnospiraceae bacterium]|nr:ABC transporter ATP-binding protein [Lachnospiraceae bacterium]
MEKSEEKITDKKIGEKENITGKKIEGNGRSTVKKAEKKEKPGKTIVEVERLNIYYDERDRKHPFRKVRRQVGYDLSFSVEQGEIFGILGESGCGKTTLVKTLLHMVEDYEGTAVVHAAHPQMIFQDPYSSLNPARKVGWLLQEAYRMSHKKAGAKTREHIRQEAVNMLQKVGLSEKYMEHYPRELSGGQRQRVCIALTLIQEPELLIADEPVSALDVTIQAQIIKLLLKLQKEMGLTILFITHDLRVASMMCRHVLIMKEGRIVEQGETKEVFRNPKSDYTARLVEIAGQKV